MPTLIILYEKPAARTSRDGLNLVWTVARTHFGMDIRNACIYQRPVRHNR